MMPQHALAVVLGSLFAFFGNELFDSLWSAFLPILLALAFLNPGYRFITLMAAAFLWSCSVFHYELDHRLHAEYENRITRLEAVVVDLPELDQKRIRLYLQPVEIEGYTGKLPRLLRLNWYQRRIVPLPGELWQFEVKLKAPGGFLNPGGFDFERWQFVKGIDGRGYIRQSTFNRRLDTAAWWNLHRWRGLLAKTIDNNCQGCTSVGLIKALGIGYRGDIPASQNSILRDSGTAHLLAISGLHIGMVSVLFFALGRLGWRLGLYRTGINRSETASVFALLAALGYAAIAGFSLPTVRALVMITILFGGLLWRSRINLLQCVSLALIIILVVDPLAVGSASFWLSISALLVIAFAQFRFSGQGRWWQQLLALQLCFFALFMPIGVVIFGQVNPAGYLANIVAIPLVSFVVLPLILVAMLTAIAGIDWSRWLFQLADALLGLLTDYLGLLLDSGMASISSASLPLALVFLLLAGMLLLLMPRGTPARSLVFALLLFPLVWQAPRLGQGEYEVTVFDVGMGTSLMLRTRHHSLVYDFGPGNERGFSAADWGLLPFMKTTGIDLPDLLIASHVDQDHSGGFRSFLGYYRPHRLLSGTPLELAARFELNHRVRSCHDYPDWRWDGVWFRFLSVASTAVDASTNNRSCVLQISGHQRTLIAGDIEAEQEGKLIRSLGDDLEADVLLAPHHGSSTSSSENFVSRVKPSHVIFTVAAGNRWGFPRASVISRYQAIAAIQYRSDIDGAISLRSTATGLRVKLSRKSGQRIWRDR